MFDRIAADMDRQADMMMQQVRSFQLPSTAGAGKTDLAAFKAMPAGTVSYSFVSTGNGQGMCSRRVQVTSYGPGQQSKVVSNSAGNCRDMPAASTATGPSGEDKAVPSMAVRTTASHDGKPIQTI
ncbi:MAG: hypothetical protein C0494_10525 [Sphingobium sp.]|nr:hypothetical protein [Sphingobium sp.]